MTKMHFVFTKFCLHKCCGNWRRERLSFNLYCQIAKNNHCMPFKFGIYFESGEREIKEEMKWTNFFESWAFQSKERKKEREEREDDQLLSTLLTRSCEHQFSLTIFFIFNFYFIFYIENIFCCIFYKYLMKKWTKNWTAFRQLKYYKTKQKFFVSFIMFKLLFIKLEVLQY